MKLEIDDGECKSYTVDVSKIRTIEDIKVVFSNMRLVFVRTKDNERAYEEIKHLLDNKD